MCRRVKKRSHAFTEEVAEEEDPYTVHSHRRHRIGDTLPESSPFCPSPVPTGRNYHWRHDDENLPFNLAIFWRIFGPPTSCQTSLRPLKWSLYFPCVQAPPRPHRSPKVPEFDHEVPCQRRRPPPALSFEDIVWLAAATTVHIITSKRSPLLSVARSDQALMSGMLAVVKISPKSDSSEKKGTH